jgi:pyoverdine/dityrosine biosynthesis protein Dit1
MGISTGILPEVACEVRYEVLIVSGWMVLCLDDSPGRAVVIFDTGTTLGAFIRVDDILFFALTDSVHGALKEAAAATDAVFGNLIGHDGLLQGRS